MLNFLGYLFLSLLILLFLLIIILIIFVKFSPLFGGKVSKEQKEKYIKSPNFQHGKFVNLQDQYTIHKSADFIDDSIKPKELRNPDFDIPYIKLNKDDFITSGEPTRITWFGHSTILLQTEGKNILADPMFSKDLSPVRWYSRPRYSKGLPLNIDELPEIDAVLITHDHYDHLDYPTIKQIKNKVKKFYTPLGVSAHLIRWGISADRIEELDWYEDARLGKLTLTLTPSHHYSGRSLSDRFETLWGGWIIKGSKDNIYLSGDGGYGPHFKKIGERYGPFDFAMIECGQYCSYWIQNHLFPEQTAQVALDVRARLIMPIHWGAFTIAMHGWADPVERLKKKVKETDVILTTPMIGEQILLDGGSPPDTEWWRKAEEKK